MTNANQMPFAPSCERNKEVILETLLPAFSDSRRLLEVGSGTGQHAVHFAQALPKLHWQSTEIPENIEHLLPRIKLAQRENLPPPMELSVLNPEAFTGKNFDSFFTANTLHIMSWIAVTSMISWLPKVVCQGAKIAIYGPFHFDGKPTSEGNRSFDLSLRANSSQSGIRNFEDVDKEMQQKGFSLLENYAMPANNRLIFWQKN